MPYPSRKLLSDHPLNTLNYMVCEAYGSKREGFIFLGITPIQSNGWWGVELNGGHYTVASLYHSTDYWGDDPRDTPEYAKLNPWIIFFMGSDDHAMFKRFTDCDAALAWFNSINGVDVKRDDCLTFN